MRLGFKGRLGGVRGFVVIGTTSPGGGGLGIFKIEKMGCYVSVELVMMTLWSSLIIFGFISHVVYLITCQKFPVPIPLLQ